MPKRSDNNNNNNNNKNDKRQLNKADLGFLSGLTPQQLAVITGLLSQALQVDSVLIDKDQKVEIVLGGSLRKKTKADKLLKQLSDVTFGEILDSINNM